MPGQEQAQKQAMGSLPNSLSLVYNLPPHTNHGDHEALSLSNFTANPSPEVNPAATNSAAKPSAPSPSTTSSGRYTECLRNHGAAIGAHILDGCGEFMPAGEEGTPESLKCAACDCHRNFHRKVPEVDGGGGLDFTPSVYLTNFQNYPTYNTGRSFGIAAAQRPLVMPPVIHHGLQHPKRFPMAPVMVTFGGGGAPHPVAVLSSSEDDLKVADDGTTIRSDGVADGHIHHHQSNSKRKRFRTKFTQEQKNKMASFAEKLGWKIGKQDEEEVARFCTETRVKRQVFKVWMHNSKQAMKKKVVQM
ncbi:hypothetical protein SAY86_031369 [Trapa natans]|uniref:ZF-HD dimerization-type domain-containing protein n=1 Tax=Trapa natans TaxID=22666 RepID=A0AAN7M6J7_TRANT|nr:hypothetical protein SAY86_031369 [Trapa natans]